MKRWLSVLLVVFLLATLVAPAQALTRQPAPTPPFWDVIGTPYQNAVGYLHAVNLVAGTGPDTFSPQQQVTRAQMAAFVVRALGKQNDPTPRDISFTDVPTSHWAYDVIMKAASLGIVKGTSDTAFAPDAPVTYAQAATMLLRALGYEKVLKGDWPVPQVLKAKELGWLDGTKFEVNAPATRGDVALILAASVFTTPNLETGLTLSQTVHRKVVSVAVGPDATYLLSGTTKLEARGIDWFGKSFSINNVQWGGVGSGYSVSQDGTLSVTNADRVTVNFLYGDKFAEKSYDVVKSFQILGSENGVKPGSTITLRAEGKTTAGRTVLITPTWSVKSGSATITKDGVLSATGGGNIVVEAKAGSLTVEQTVVSASGVAVSPGTVTLAVGQKQKFTAQITDAAGNAISLPVTWSIVQGSGEIAADGTLTAGNSGPIKVQASVGGITGQATVQLISRITVSPSPASVAKGGTVQFNATGYTLEGSAVPVTPNWSSTGGVGIIGTNGTMVGTTMGSGTVVAELYGLRVSVPVTVAGEATAIRIETTRASMPANGKSTATITATVVDSRGTPAQGSVETISFGMSSSTLGTLSATTAKVENGKATVTFTPSEQAGQLIIFASAPGTNLISGSTTISTVAPTVSRIRLEAYPATLAADSFSRTQITAYLEDNEGVAIKNQTGAQVHVTLSTSAGATGVLESTIIAIPAAQSSGSVWFRSSNTVGSTKISGAGLYTVSPVTVNTVIVGNAAKLNIRPNIQETRADGSQVMQIQVEVQDSNGYVRTGESGTLLQLSVSSDSNTMAPLTASTVGGVATFSVTTTKAGTYTLRATGYSTAIAAAETTATFLAGPAYRLRLSADPSTQIAADGLSVVRLKAKIVDQYENVVKTASNQVTFTKTSNQGATNMTNSQTVTPVDGVAVLELKATLAPGSDTFNATATGLANSESVSITSRITGNAYKLRVQALSPTSIVAGQSTTVQVYVLDALDQLVTGATGRVVSLISSSPTAVVSGPQSTVGGVATFTISDTKSGTITFTATSDGLQSDTVGRTLNVAAGNISSIQLLASPEGVAADGLSTTNITAKAVDAYGNQVPWSTSIQLQIDNSTSARLLSTYLYSGGQVSLQSTTTPGVVRVSGTAQGVPVAPVVVNTYIPAAPARVVVEQIDPVRVSGAYVNPATFRVKVLDVNGNLATGTHTGALMSAIGVTITGSAGTNTTRITSGSTSGLPGFVANGVNTGSSYVTNGVATFQFTNTLAESVVINPVAYYNGQPLATTSARITTTPGAASRITVTPDNLVLTAQSPMPLVLQAAVTDEFGNPVGTADDALTFTPNNTNFLTFPENLSITTSTGTASITVTSKITAVGGDTLLTIRSAKTGLTGTVSVKTDLPPGKPTVRATGANGLSTVIPVQDGVVKVTVTGLARQSSQTVLVYVNGQLKTAYTGVDFLTAHSTMGSQETTWTGYLRTSDFQPGNSSVTVILTNNLGLSPVSDPAAVTIN